jgi:protein-tyrosine phosphatase
MNSVLFVCTANRFRSPLASAIFTQLLQDSGKADAFTVSDAGTWADEGLPVTREAQIIGERLGVDLSKHGSRVVTGAVLSDYNIVIVMETGHKEAIVNEFPEAGSKVFVLTEFSGGTSYDIPDPYSIGEDAEEISAEIERLLVKNFDLIVQLSR